MSKHYPDDRPHDYNIGDVKSRSAQGTAVQIEIIHDVAAKQSVAAV